MSVSAVQLVANQNNAKKSTGPVTLQGKQAVSNNALKHGVFSNGVKDIWFVPRQPISRLVAWLNKLSSQLIRNSS
jgi:hypothetical protein